ncbi:hypothetical protein E6O75_ATG07202 [Venturia nashicola]|uniref:Uncharacterized protein n=1 Tax=Venturia nashicola TaxID=86259 RepID=A0A4Z1NJG9_9PEZI|nr:hypothetical protein E6O75_ATG07202 [Venturia nashicola]
MGGVFLSKSSRAIALVELESAGAIEEVFEDGTPLCLQKAVAHLSTQYSFVLPKKVHCLGGFDFTTPSKTSFNASIIPRAPTRRGMI